MRRGPVVVPLTLFALLPRRAGWRLYPLHRVERLPFAARTIAPVTIRCRPGGATRSKRRFSCQADDMLRSEYSIRRHPPAYCHFAAAAHCHLTLWRRRLYGSPAGDLSASYAAKTAPSSSGAAAPGLSGTAPPRHRGDLERGYCERLGAVVFDIMRGHVHRSPTSPPAASSPVADLVADLHKHTTRARHGGAHKYHERRCRRQVVLS